MNKKKESNEKELNNSLSEIFENLKEDDMKDGKQILFYFNGDRYEGEFRNSFKEGKGIYYNNSYKYKGEFKNDMKDRKGFYYKNGDKYEGEFKKDIKEGIGISFDKDGGIYEREFKNCKKDGSWL